MQFSPFGVLVVAIALAASACGPIRSQDRVCQIEQMLSDEPSGDAKDKAFFPDGFAEEMQSDQCGIERPRLGEVEREWFPNQWRAACEPPLFDGKQSGEGVRFTFRFSYLPSRDHSIFLRLEKDEDAHRLIVKQMTGRGGYEPGVVSRSKELELSEDDIQFVRRKLEELRASRAAEAARLDREGPKDICFGTLDGTEWIFEVVEKGNTTCSRTPHQRKANSTNLEQCCWISRVGRNQATDSLSAYAAVSSRD